MLQALDLPPTTCDAHSLLDKVNFELLAEEGYDCKLPPSQCFLVLHIHVLSSTLIFIDKLVALGFRRSSIFIIPKTYSTIEEVSNQLRNIGCHVWSLSQVTIRPGRYDEATYDLLRTAISEAALLCKKHEAKRCVLVDDGGFLSQGWLAAKQNIAPDCDVITIAQTSSGLYRYRKACVYQINVAASAGKKHFESKVIVNGVMAKIKSDGLLRDTDVSGVIGMGALGSRLATRLISDGYLVNSYDINPNKLIPFAYRQTSWLDTIKKSNVIFGCTGRNFMHFNNGKLFNIEGVKHCFSVSSRDVEFKYLLSSAQRIYKNYETVEVATRDGAVFRVYNGGFPINFDRKKEWEPFSDISITRSFLLLAVISVTLRAEISKSQISGKARVKGAAERRSEMARSQGRDERTLRCQYGRLLRPKMVV